MYRLFLIFLLNLYSLDLQTKIEIRYYDSSYCLPILPILKVWISCAVRLL
jgi:hypothetical protein